jgi:zinc/manganese transport system substrate-binding protein
MKTGPLALSAALVALAMALPRPAAAALKVVTTTEGLAALAREVGGDRVEVQSLSRGIQDPHFVDANPILAVKLRAADLLVDVGLDLEIGWLPPLVGQSRNAAIQPGGARRLTAASAVSALDVPSGAVDRSTGDLHPGGNPHFLTDPRRALQVAVRSA